MNRLANRSASRATRAALAAAAALIGALGGACHTEALIETNPPGATVEVDGVRGVTPFTASLGVTTFGNYPIRAEMDGFEKYDGEVAKDPDVNSILGSVVCPPLWLVLWNRATPGTVIELKAIKPFPSAYAHEEPTQPFLPPLPPGMDPVKYKGLPESKPAAGK